jgi:hypothetical protein
MRLKKLALLLAGPVAALGAVAPTTAAHATPGAAVCVVAGRVHLNPGVPVNPLSTAGGTYAFTAVEIVCAGTVSGATGVTSNGNYANPALGVPTFSGSFNTGAFLGTGQTCSGDISGIRAGAIVEASLANVNCAGGVAAPTLNTAGAGGAVVLAFVPDPTTLTGVGGPDLAVVNDAYLAGAAVIAGGS